MKYAGLLALVVFSLVWLSAGRSAAVGDAALNCRAARSLLEHGRPDVPAGMRVDLQPGRDGRFYAKYPLLSSLTCLPAVAAYSAAPAWFEAHPPFAYLMMAVVPAALGGLLAAGFFLLLSLLGTPRRFALGLAFALVSSTPLWIYARNYYGEILQGALYTWLLYFFLAGRQAGCRRDLFCGGLTLGLILNTKAMLALGGLGALLWFWRGGRQQWRNLALYGLAGFAPGLALWLGYNAFRYGHLFALGYSVERDAQLSFSTPLLSGLYGLLFSSGKSLFLYAPLFALVPFLAGDFLRRHRAAGWLLLAPALLLLTANAKWWAWHGDWGWGPRLLLPLLPALALPLSEIPRRGRRMERSFWLLAGLGLAVQGLGVVVSSYEYLQLIAHGAATPLFAAGVPLPRDDLAAVHFLPELSPLAGHAWILLGWGLGTPWALAHFPWKSLQVSGGPPAADLFPSAPDLWWVGHPAYAWFALFAMAAILIWAVRAWRRSGVENGGG